jgi:hypothetical protein
MNNSRQGLRVTCNAKCILVLGDSKHEGTLADVSISGALVRTSEDPTGIHTLCSCGLYLCNDPNVCPGEYACQVTRVNQNDIGLMFVNTLRRSRWRE